MALNGIAKVIIFFFLIFIGSTVAFFILFFTTACQEIFVENLALKNGSKALDWWIDPKIEPYFKVHFFNYTNFEEYLNGLAPKLILEDVGPYVYKEKIAKTDLVFHEKLITYRENRTQKFLQHESGSLREDDTVIVPNLLVIGAYESAKYSFIKRSFVKSVISNSNSKVYKIITAEEFLWGYEDDFIKKLKSLRVEKFGMFKTRKGVGNEFMTVYTGEDDLNNMGRLYSFDNKTVMEIWKSDECNTVDGSDGSQFPPNTVYDKKKIEIFVKEFCRRFPLVFDSETTALGDIPVYRYKPPRDIFDTSKTNPDNQCYEINDKFIYNGIFLDRPCISNVSMFISYPHFLYADKELLEPFEGLSPDEEAHGTTADIHTKLAFPIGGHSRFQFNILVEANTIDPRIKKDIILPILWIEVTSGDIPEQYMELIQSVTCSSHHLHDYLKLGSVITIFVSSILMLLSIFIFYVSEKSSEEEIHNDNIVVALGNIGKTVSKI